MTVEILCHIYPQTILAGITVGTILLDLSFKNVAITVFNELLSHTSIINCGETAKDNNREVFDLIAPLRGVIESLVID